MCGIAGLLDPTPSDLTEITTSVRSMTDALAHRGPDGAGTWVDADAGIGLGNRRLSVIDLSSRGTQPMRSASGRWVVAFNGEIYNFQALRRRLEGLGHRFRGESDTEVLVEALDQWGVEAALDRLNGMFAVAAWDRDGRRLHLARDRLGEKPLYWAWAGRRLAFASELKAIRVLPDFPVRVDRDVLALYLRHNCVPAPYAIYTDAGKLLPGQVVTVSTDDVARRRLPTEQYWTAADCVETGRGRALDSRGEAVEALAEGLDEAVRMRLVADVPVGAFLSGGIDSSLVVASMCRHTDRVRTFTVGFADAAYDESAAAAAVAAHLGTDHTHVQLSSGEALEIVPRLADLWDEPFSDSSQIPTTLVAELARRDVTVVLSGDGGDELFAGYNRHEWTARMAPRVERVPRSIRRFAAAGLAAIPPDAIDRGFAAAGRLAPTLGRLRNPSTKVAKVAQVLPLPDMDQVYLRLVSHWPDPSALVAGGREPPTLVTDLGREPCFEHPVERLLYRDLVTYLPDDILTKVDRATMAVGLEARVPLLDPDVVELAWRMPLDAKLHDGRSKWVLRELLQRDVPRHLFERPKMGFGLPLANWLRHELRPWAEDLLARDQLEASDLSPDPVRQAWSDHLAGRADHGYALWDVLMFQSWAARWLP